MITVHLNGENWKTHTSEHLEISNADMNDRKVREAFRGFIAKGFVNVNCVMEDSQSPEWSNTRYTHPYTYNHNGDSRLFTYDDNHRKDDINH